MIGIDRKQNASALRGHLAHIVVNNLQEVLSH